MVIDKLCLYISHGLLSVLDVSSEQAITIIPECQICDLESASHFINRTFPSAHIILLEV